MEVPIEEEENTNELVMEAARLVEVKLTNGQTSASNCLTAKPKRTENEGKS